MESILKVQLDDFLKVPGVNTVVIVDQDGFMIEGVGRSEAEAAGAAIASSMQSCMKLGQELAAGALRQGMLEYEEAVLVTAGLGTLALLCVLCDPGANLGMIRLEVKRRTPELSASL
jgi:predicted regulator of Ras-like GTPase activity (Roadblock/LC7/MglB family)